MEECAVDTLTKIARSASAQIRSGHDPHAFVLRMGTAVCSTTSCGVSEACFEADGMVWCFLEMQQAPVILVLMLAFSALLAAFMSAWSISRHNVGGAVELALLLASDSLYTMGYALEISRNQIGDILVTSRVQYLGLAFMPSLLFLFVLNFVRKRPMGRGGILLLLVIPAITLGAVFTMDRHALFYVSPRVIDTGFFPMLAFERGPLYWLKLVNEEVLILVSVVLLAVHAVRTRGKVRLQTSLVCAGALVPFLASMLYVLGKIPWRLDPAPFAGLITGVLFALALFRLKLFELVPAARALALDAVEDGFLVVDEELRLQDMNRAARQLLGSGAVLGRPLPNGGDVLNLAVELSTRGEGRGECRQDVPGTGERIFQLNACFVEDPDGATTGSAVLIRDVTENRHLMEALEKQALLDPLTGVLNRRGLSEVLERENAQAVRKGASLAVLMVDLDHFKRFNDRYGHAVGDAVLRQTCIRLEACLRAGDVLGRFGGEEFVVLLPDTDDAAARRAAERLRAELSESAMEIGELRLDLTASFGGKVGAMEGDATGLLRAADAALYQAKEQGRNRVVFAPS